MRTCLLIVLSIIAMFIALSCDDDHSKQTQTQTGTAPREPLPAGLIVDASPPAAAKDVADVRTTAADGDEVLVHGRIGGSERPFVEGRAAFQLVDLSLLTCDKAGNMHTCKTPWDYCCDAKEDVFGKSVTVQVSGKNGQPLRADLTGVGGLKPMSEVAVKGKVKKSEDGKAMTLDATALYVKQ